MARSLRSRKQQTRLAFQPLPSSSPVKNKYSSAVQDRLATVRFQGSASAQTTRSASRTDKHSSLPTPEPSSQANPVDQRSSPPLQEGSSSPTLPLPASRDHDVGVEDQTEEDDEDIPIPSSKRRRLSERLLQSTLESNTSPRRSIRQKQHSSPLSERRKSNQLCRSDQLNQPPSPVWRLPSIGSAETSGDEEDAIITKPKQRRRTTKTQKDDPFIVEDDDVTYISSEEDSYKNIRKTPRRASNRGDDFVVGNDEIEYLTSDEEPKAADESRSSHKKNLKARKKKLAREQEELEEDLLDLQDSDNETNDKHGRTRGGPVNTQRDKSREHFARLRRQRAGERISRVIESDEEDDYEGHSEVEAVDIDQIQHQPDHVEIMSDTSSSQPSLIGAPDPEFSSNVRNIPSDNEGDFIIDDMNVNTRRHGLPHPDIPLQFTSFASSKPRELFIHIIEWMVKNKISPAFSRDDDVFTMSFSRIDDQVKAQAGSRLISSAWNATFKYAILARPGMNVVALPGLDEDNVRTCDACNRTNHPARYDFTFEGQAYNKDTLEPVDDDDNEDEDSDGSDQDDDEHSPKAEYDQQGHLLASESQHFYLGRFCAANAEMGHKLSHWKYHLNEQVLIYLEEQGVLSPEALVARERLNKKKREKEAENIVDMMEETGEVAKLWQGFQDDLEDARFGMEDHHSGRRGARSKARIGSVRVERSNGTIGEYGENGRYKEVGRVESDSEG